MTREWMYGLCLVSLLGFTAGCAGSSDEYRELGSDDDVTNVDAHDHHHDEGPHGGHILEFGAYHGEVTMGEDRAVTLYVLGDDAETAVPVTATSATLKLEHDGEVASITLEAAPQEGEADGASSRYVAAGESIPEGVADIEGLVGSIELVVGDETHTAKISHDHHHGHDHGDHGHDDHDHGDHKE